MNTIGLLSRKFSEMPVWVQVVTYLVLLGLYVYLLLCPRFINGQIVAKTGHGGIVPYRGVNMQVSVEGRLLKFKTNESGFWSVPVVSRLPERMRIQVYHEDENAWHEVVLSASKIWKQGDFRIEIMNREPWIEVEEVAALPSGFKLMVPGSGPGEAVAGELVIPNQAALNASGIISRDQIGKDVRGIISSVTGTEMEEINENYPLSGKNAPGYIERIQIIEHLEQKVRVPIPDEHWRELSSVGQLIDYLYNRKVLENYRPDIYRKKNTYNWAIMQQQAPSNERPVFVPAK